MIRRFILIGFYLMMLAGCSGKPSESAIADQIEQKINQQFGVDFVQIDALKRINGRTKNDGKYIAKVAYDIVFTKDVDDVAREMLDATNQPPANSPEAALTSVLAGVGAIGLRVTFGKFKQGDRKHIIAMLRFAKWDDGWVLVK